MGARYFIPTSGEYAWTGSVWAATATGAAGSAATPATGDDVYILTGTASITSGLNQSAVNLNSLTIGFSGQVGTATASLQIGLGSGDSAHIYGSGTHYLTIVEAAAGTSTINYYDDSYGALYLNACSIGYVYCGRNGQLFATGGTFVHFVFSSGCACTINETTLITEMYFLGGNHLIRSASVDVVNMFGEPVVTASGATACNGVVVQNRSAGTYVHDSAGTIDSLELYTGATAKTTGAYGGFTVTVSSMYSGSKMFENSPVPITYTNATAKYGFR